MKPVQANKCVIACTLVAALTLSLSVGAEEQAESARQQSHRILEEVMASDEFHQKSTLRVPKFLEDFFSPADTAEQTAPELPWLSKLLSALASILEVLLWLGLVALVSWLVYRFRLWDFSERRPVERKPDRPAVLMGLNVEADAQPENVRVAAEDAWQKGQPRQAVSLLYRAALIRLMDEHHCKFEEGDTEGQCLGEARAQASSAAADYFEHLTLHWQRLAYAHHRLNSEQFHTLLGGWERAWHDHER